MKTITSTITFALLLGLFALTPSEGIAVNAEADYGIAKKLSGIAIRHISLANTRGGKAVWTMPQKQAGALHDILIKNNGYKEKGFLDSFQSYKKDKTKAHKQLVDFFKSKGLTLTENHAEDFFDQIDQIITQGKSVLSALSAVLPDKSQLPVSVKKKIVTKIENMTLVDQLTLAEYLVSKELKPKEVRKLLDLTRKELIKQKYQGLVLLIRLNLGGDEFKKAQSVLTFN